MKGSSIELDMVRAGYGGEEVLRGVSLSVDRGRIAAILGPSGCGKTTLLRVIAGLVIPRSGRVLLDGKDVTRLPPEKRDIGFVFQDLALFPHMNVFDNVAFGLKVRGVSREEIRRRVEWALEVAGLNPPRDFFSKKVTDLSGGQQQRVALARAIAYEPKVLLLDEPLSHLDLKIRQRLLVEFRRLQRELGITMVYVTHDQWEAMELADILVIMKDGQIVQAGPPSEVYSRPVNTYVAMFFGDANIIPVNGSSRRRYAVIRPEDLEISLDPNAASHANSFRATVENVVFQGPVIRVDLKWEHGTIRALIPRRQAQKLPRIGEEVTVRWRPEDAWIVEG